MNFALIAMKGNPEQRGKRRWENSTGSEIREANEAKQGQHPMLPFPIYSSDATREKNLLLLRKSGYWE